MYEVLIAADARDSIQLLPISIQVRIQGIAERLRHWPQVSGVKALRGELHGAFRVRTGDYRILFTVNPSAKLITMFRVADRRDVYE